MKQQFKHLRLLTLYLAKLAPRKDQGYVMVVVIGLSIAMFGLLNAYVLISRTERLGMNSSRDSSTGFSAAEAGLNLRAEALRRDFLGFNRPSGDSPNSTFCATSGTDTTNDFRCINYNFPSEVAGQPARVVTTYIQDITETDPACTEADRKRCEPRLSRVPSGDTFQGLSMQEYTYRIYGVSRTKTQLSSTGQITQNSPVESIMEMQVKSRLIPMFQFAAFYVNDLEISPGPVMQFDGPIHTNGRLMLAGWAGTGGLRINGQITTAQQLFNAVVEDNCGNNCTELTRRNNNGGVQIRNAGNTAWINLLEAGTGATTPTSGSMFRLENSATNPFGAQVQVRVKPVDAPVFKQDNNFLRCGSSDTQDICSRADINITYDPGTVANLSAPTNAELARLPFAVKASNRSNQGNLLASRDLSIGELHSLRQPVLVTPIGGRIPGARGSVSNTRTNENLSGVCAPLSNTNSDLNTLNTWLNLSANATAKTRLETNQTAIQNALRVALISQLRPVPFSQLGMPLTTIPATAPDLITGDLRQSVAFRFQKSLQDQLGVSNANQIILDLRRGNPSNPLPAMNVIAAVAGGGCFVSAPIQEILVFRNDREKDGGNDRNIRMLQMNIASLTIWNRDGRYLIFDGNTIRDDNGGRGLTAETAVYFPAVGQPPRVCPPSPPVGGCSNSNFSSNAGVRSFLFRVLDADANAPIDSFQRFGYAAADRSHGGMAVHFGMKNGIGGVAAPNAFTFPNYQDRRSPYGFALTGGRQLFGRARYNGYNENPAGVTFASNQAIYVQGDFNNFLTDPNDPTFQVNTANFNAMAPATLVWQPAAILADSVNILSNSCRFFGDDQIRKTGDGMNCNNQTDGTINNRPVASPTTTRAAFLSGTDVTGSPTVPGFSGGLQNYPRYSENWGGGTYHVYTGSFVSLGSPLEVNGRWDQQEYSPPRRIWAYETRFNNAANLPPLTPRFVSLQQETYRRSYTQN